MLLRFYILEINMIAYSCRIWKFFETYHTIGFFNEGHCTVSLICQYLSFESNVLTARVDAVIKTVKPELKCLPLYIRHPVI